MVAPTTRYEAARTVKPVQIIVAMRYNATLHDTHTTSQANLVQKRISALRLGYPGFLGMEGALGRG